MRTVAIVAALVAALVLQPGTAGAQSTPPLSFQTAQARASGRTLTIVGSVMTILSVGFVALGGWLLSAIPNCDKYTSGDAIYDGVGCINDQQSRIAGGVASVVFGGAALAVAVPTLVIGINRLHRAHAASGAVTVGVRSGHLVLAW